LQHQDGQSHIQASTIPNCQAYDPSYGYELAVIIQDGIKRMYGEMQENIFYYLTVTNENYAQPAIKDASKEGILKGIYLFDTIKAKHNYKVKLLGCGAIFKQSRIAADILANEYNMQVELFSVTSFTNLAREAQEISRWNLLHPSKENKISFVSHVLGSDENDIVVAATDYMKSYAEQIRAYVPGSYQALGTDGFGRSDSRDNLRAHFEVDASFIVISVLSELVNKSILDKKVMEDAMLKFNINQDKTSPFNA